MKFWLNLKALLLLLLIGGMEADAQSFFGLSVTSSVSSILVSNSLTYTITVTNNTAGTLSTALVSNVFSAPVLLVDAMPGQGSVTNYGNAVVFNLGPFLVNAISQMTLTIQPAEAGFLTNTVTVTTPDLVISPVSASVTTQVTNVVPPEADLVVALSGPGQQTNIVNDPITYKITASNFGPDDASGIQCTNSLPTGLIYKSVSPPTVPYSVSGSNVIFNLGTLAAGTGTNFQVTVQATNTGIFPISAALGAADMADTNTANNSASTNLAVINYLSTNLTVTLVTAQKYNAQNGLVEQTIKVTNIGSSAIPAARVVVAGLTNVLFNAWSTNSGNPFVVYADSLAVNQSVNLVLQFYVPNYFPFAASQCQAFGVPMPDLSPPAVSSINTSLTISRILRLANGTVLIEFPSVAGRSYSVVYNASGSLPNAIAPPAIVAVGNRLQWIDYGPPTTISAPTNAAARFYRIIQNP